MGEKLKELASLLGGGKRNNIRRKPQTQKIEQSSVGSNEIAGSSDGAGAKQDSGNADQHNNERSSPGPDPRVPTPKDVALAKSRGATPEHVAARKKVARHYVENNGFKASQIEDILGSENGKKVGGVDLDKPLEVVHYPPPDYMHQHVASHGYPGSWFDPIGNQSPSSLGISGEGRTAADFKMPTGTGLQSHARPILDNWTNPDNPVQTVGGGTQLVVNDETKALVNKLNGL